MAIYLRWGTGKWGDLWGRGPVKLLLAGGGRVSFSVSTHTSTNVRIQAGGTTQVVVRKSVGIPVVLRSGASLATTGTYTEGDPESTHWSRLQGERASWVRLEAAQGMWTVFYPNLSDRRDKK